MRIGYVVKRYPRFSETFIVNEILAHERAGAQIEIFATRPILDTHFQDRIARVRGAVNYLPAVSIKGSVFWDAIRNASSRFPSLWSVLEAEQQESAIDIYQAIVLATEARHKQLDHLHAHFATSATSVTRLASRIAEIPFTFTAHAKDIFHDSVCDDDLARKLHDAAAVITVSDFNVAYLQRRFAAAKDRIGRIYNGLDLSEFAYEPPAQRPRRIVAVGRLVEKKGFADLIDACALLRQRGVEFECDLIGTGELHAALQQRIDRHQLGDTVHLLGPRPQRELIGEVRRAAALACPCIVGSDGNRDGLPTVLLEAMALGTPCVATDVTGIGEVVRDQVTGLLLPPGEPAALATALHSLLDRVDLRVQFATAARRLIERDFDVNRATARMRQLFQEGPRDAAAEHPALQEVS